VVPIPGLSPSDLGGGLQKSVQTSAGVEADLDEATVARATFFHNAFFDMTDAIGTSNGEIERGFVDRSRGRAYGMELFFHRRLSEDLGGFVAYTLSRSERTIGREEFASAFDRTHVANAAASYHLGRNWRIGGRIVFYTGTPKSSPTNGLLLGRAPSSPDRNPPFYRLDVRLEKRWALGSRAWISGILECLNATLSKETFGSVDGRSESIGPITIPSIGVEAGF
jgi:hypothetical protein